MTAQTRTHWIEVPQMDYVLLAIVILLLVVGLMMIWSVTFAPRAMTQANVEPQSIFMKQAGFAALGLLLLFTLARIDYRVWERLAVPLMALTLAALVALLFSKPINNAQRWLFDGSVQPSEAAKFTVVVYMAAWLSSKGEKLRQVTYGLLPFGIFVGVLTGLILRQPNLSTAIIIALCAAAMFFIAGADTIQFILLLIVGGASIAVVVANTQYLSERWEAFLQDPFVQATEKNYHLRQTLIALGSGGLLGVGFGNGFMKFGYVPTAYTDSIFALLGEELGLVGTWAVLALYLALVYRGFRIAANARDPFGQLLAAGISFWLVFQAFVNIAVVTDSIPYTGVPLPFISFGGSALASALAAVGVLLNISRGGNASKEDNATFDFGWRNGGTRVSRVSRRHRNSQKGNRR